MLLLLQNNALLQPRVVASQAVGEAGGWPLTVHVPNTDRRWTLEERNAHAILYSLDPALAAMAYRRGRN
jgi:hypothetical protein